MASLTGPGAPETGPGTGSGPCIPLSGSGISFPLTAQRLVPLIGHQITAYAGNLFAAATLGEVTNEYVVLVDTNGVRDLFPLNTVSVVEWT